MFIDIAKIHIKAGDGGNGRIGFRRAKYVPKGGPDGGDGGDGGHIIAVGNGNMNTLMDLKYKRRFKAENGKNGEGNRCTGRSGRHRYIDVPVGTVIRHSLTGEVLADVKTHGQEIIIATGGRGGLGNMNFATSVNQAPRYATPGKPGDELEAELELKLLADAGLVGFPNAGKSTLIASLSAARPKIADYPFTTLVPNLGIVYADKYRSFCLADIPGLIEGASDGRGLGVQFLRHVERCKVHIYLLDGLDDIDVEDQYRTLRTEVLKFNTTLQEVPHIICINKADGMIDEMREDYLERRFDGQQAVIISAVSGEGLSELKQIMFELIQATQETYVVLTRHIPPTVRERKRGEVSDDEEYGDDDDFFGDDGEGETFSAGFDAGDEDDVDEELFDEEDIDENDIDEDADEESSPDRKK
jgi:GTP-binding protein